MAQVKIYSFFTSGCRPELKIKPWEVIKKDLEEANNVTKWENREPYAYWKGNAKLGRRPELVKCNLSEEHDWNARIYAIVILHNILRVHHILQDFNTYLKYLYMALQDWQKERRAEGFKNSDLTDQCTHKLVLSDFYYRTTSFVMMSLTLRFHGCRYKIYVEGNAWSVSEKYILACDSVTLIINTHFYDFFTRSLVPTVHYWPINENQECRSIKFAVDWGNHHPEKVTSCLDTHRLANVTENEKHGSKLFCRRRR